MITILEQPVPFGGGIELPSNKALSLDQGLIKADLPGLITVPLRQHIGLPSKPIITSGEHVLKGQMIAKAQGYISASVYASTSGRVKEISEQPVPDPSNARSSCIVIEADGDDRWIEGRASVDDFYSLSPVELQQKVFEAGIVGLGGAGFPSAVKLIPGLNLDIELLILNAAECEPYISCDETLIRHQTKDVIKGFEILAHALQVDECVIAIEKNKTEAIAILKEALENHAEIDIRLMLISDLYPAGGEKQIIKSITGIGIPADGLPVDIGVVCYNVGTAVAVKKAILDCEPLISRIVTVTGAGIKQAANLEVLIGTNISEVIKQCGGYTEDFDYLIMGGPMMGFRLHSDQVPIIKTSNCLLAKVNDREAREVKESPCIRCDECARVCPVGLQAQQLHWHSKAFNVTRLERYRLFDCIECACCSYVCPSHIPLLENYRQSKSRIWNIRRKQLQAEQNKQRYLDKLSREMTQKDERSANKTKMNKQKEKNELGLEEKQAHIAAAVKRVKEKRELKNN